MEPVQGATHLIFKTGTLTGLEPDKFSRPAALELGDLPVFSGVENCKHVISPLLSHVVLGTELRTSGLYGKHITN